MLVVSLVVNLLRANDREWQSWHLHPHRANCQRWPLYPSTFVSSGNCWVPQALKPQVSHHPVSMLVACWFFLLPSPALPGLYCY